MDNELPSKTTEANPARLLSAAPRTWILFLRSVEGRGECRAGLAAVFGMQQIRFPEINGATPQNLGDERSVIITLRITVVTY